MSTDFDLDARWQINERVSIRPERFGALVYHFGTRRLSFLKNTTIVEVVRGLDGAASARQACLRAGVTDAELGTYRQALASLAASDTICEERPS